MSVKPAEPVIRIILHALIFLLIAVLVAEKALLFAKFSVQYTDEDQCVLWASAGELMKGRLHEPCFYGQAYSSCLEGWLAAPLVLCGLQFCQAVPLVTIILSTLPFLLLAGLFTRRGNYLVSVAILACVLLFSTDYKLISIMPRGFMTGVFLFGIGYYILLRGGRRRFFWFSLLSFLGIVLNETTFFMVFPAFCFLLKDEHKNRDFYIQSVLGLLLAGAYKLYTWLFYNVLHPGYNSYVKAKFDWNEDRIKDITDHLNDWLFGQSAGILLAALMLMLLFVLRKQWLQAAVLLTTMLLLYLSFGLERVHDGTPSIFYSRSRFYVFIPMLFAVFISACSSLYELALDAQLRLSVPLAAAMLCICTVQQKGLLRKIEMEMLRDDKIVAAMPVSEVYQKTFEYIAICKATHNRILAIDCPEKNTFIFYNTIPLLSHNDVQVYQPSYDRKTWVLQELGAQQPDKILVYGNFDDRYARPALQGYKRRLVRKNPDGLVEYYLTKPLKQTFSDDFQLPMRSGTNN